MWEGPPKAENFEPLDSQGFISPEEVVSHPHPRLFLPLTEGINPSLSAWRLITRFEAKQTPGGNAVHEEGRYITKELNVFANSVK